MTSAVTQNTCFNGRFPSDEYPTCAFVSDRLLGPHYAIHLLQQTNRSSGPHVCCRVHQVQNEFHNRGLILPNFGDGNVRVGDEFVRKAPEVSDRLAVTRRREKMRLSSSSYLRPSELGLSHGVFLFVYKPI